MRPSRSSIALLSALLIVASCGQAPATTPYAGAQPRTAIEKLSGDGAMGNFQVVAHNALIDSKFNIPRGQNGGITAIRDCLYVGSNLALQPTLILDMKDMTKPTVVGELSGIKGKGMGIEAIEAVPDLNLLVNTARASFPVGSYGFPVAPEDKNIGLVVYDATDCRKPTVVAKVDVKSDLIHYMTLWRDPNRPERVFASVTYYPGTPEGIDLRVYDLTGCPKSCAPKQIAEWGLRQQFGVPQRVEVPYEGGKLIRIQTAHDVTWSIDGSRIHVAQMHFGYFQLDSTPLSKGAACNPASPQTPTASGYCLTMLNPDLSTRVMPYGVGAAHTHGVVKIPGRPYVAVQHEPSGGCPYGGIEMVYVGAGDNIGGPGSIAGSGRIRGDLFPKVVSEFGIPEDEIDRCGPDGTPNSSSGLLANFNGGVHNLLAFPNVMFATWYSGGLRAVDITNPQMPFEIGYFFNKPAADVRWCQASCKPAEVDAEGVPVRVPSDLPPEILARSYPIIMNGYVVYSDSNTGVYVLKYTGPHADEIPQAGICIAHNPSVVKPGFEPCPPYNDSYHK